MNTPPDFDPIDPDTLATLQGAEVWVTEKPNQALNLAQGMALAFGVELGDTRRMRDLGYLAIHRRAKGLPPIIILPYRGHLLEFESVNTYLPTVALNERNVFAVGCDWLIDAELLRTPRREPLPRANNLSADVPEVWAPILPFRLAAQLLKISSKIVNASDIDVEGQSLFNEVCVYLGIDPKSPHIYRLALVSQRAEDIAALLREPLELNGADKWERKAQASYARARFDFVYGMLMSRAVQWITGIRHASIGRVQTAVIAAVCTRQDEIDNFKPTAYYVPEIFHRNGTTLKWTRRKDAANMPGFDAEGRIIDKRVADEIANAINARRSIDLTEVSRRTMIEAAPLPHDLCSLVVESCKRGGLTIEQAEEAAKSLYSKHKAITYIGTSIRLYSKSALATRAQVTDTLSRHFQSKVRLTRNDLTSSAFVDEAELKKQGAEHYAIAPTGESPKGSMTDAEKTVFEVVSSRYLSQFTPNHRYTAHEVVAVVGNDTFMATREETITPGWRSVEKECHERGIVYNEVDLLVPRDEDLDVDVDVEAQHDVR